MSTSKKNESEATSETKIRIVYQGECAKLTSRGKGKLSYELGVNDKTEENFIRIAGNSQGCPSQKLTRGKYVVTNHALCAVIEYNTPESGF